MTSKKNYDAKEEEEKKGCLSQNPSLLSVLLLLLLLFLCLCAYTHIYTYTSREKRKRRHTHTHTYIRVSKLVIPTRAVARGPYYSHTDRQTNREHHHHQIIEKVDKKNVTK